MGAAGAVEVRSLTISCSSILLVCREVDGEERNFFLEIIRFK